MISAEDFDPVLLELVEGDTVLGCLIRYNGADLIVGTETLHISGGYESIKEALRFKLSLQEEGDHSIIDSIPDKYTQTVIFSSLILSRVDISPYRKSWKINYRVAEDEV